MLAHSEQLGDLATALAQCDFPNVDLDGTGQVGQNRNYRYATLAHIIKTVTPILHKNGLSVVQTCEPAAPGSLRVTTTMLHASGQYLEGTLEMPAGNTPQQAGSALTYARRYSLSAILGIAADEDDDGVEASQGKPARARTAPAAPPQAPTAPAAQDAPFVPYGDMKPGQSPDVARRWFFAKLKEDHQVTPDQAKALLGIKSFTDDMGDKTFDQILHFVGVALLRQQKAASAAN